MFLRCPTKVRQAAGTDPTDSAGDRRRRRRHLLVEFCDGKLWESWYLWYINPLFWDQVWKIYRMWTKSKRLIFVSSVGVCKGWKKSQLHNKYGCDHGCDYDSSWPWTAKPWYFKSCSIRICREDLRSQKIRNSWELRFWMDVGPELCTQVVFQQPKAIRPEAPATMLARPVKSKC